MTKWEIHPSVLLKVHSVLHMPISASEGCYNAGKLPARLRERHRLYSNLKVTKACWSSYIPVLPVKSPSQILYYDFLKINANFSVASKKLSVTLSKAEIYSVYFTPFKPSHLQAELRAEPSGNLPLKEEVSSKSEQTGSQRMTWWYPQVVSLPWWLLQTGNLLKGMIISFPALWSKDSLLVFTRYWDPVRQTLLATSRGSKLPCVQDLVVVRWVHDFLQEKKPQRKIWN